MCLGDSKVLCCRSTFESNAEIGGPKGLCSEVDKFLCCVNSCSLNPACGICDQWLMGRPYGEDMPVEDGDEAWMQRVFWLYYCVFCGCGVTGISPCVHQDSKFLCLQGNSRTMDMCEGGFLHGRSKVCCCVEAVECPPTMDIGLALCGIKCVGKTAESARELTGGVGPQQQEMS